MPFSGETKRRMFEQCLRLCCLCFKQCSTNIEAAHIIDESDGGSNDKKNGIPVCFDCHSDIGHYRKKHPKGNKFSPKELRNRRNGVYELVESGAMYALLITEKLRTAQRMIIPQKDLTPKSPIPEAQKLLERMLSGDAYASGGGKLKLLDSVGRSYVLDKLIKESHRPKVIEVLMQIAESSLLSNDERHVMVERAARQVCLHGDALAKAAFMRCVQTDVLQTVPDDIREALFEEVITIIEHDQFEDVNQLVPALEIHLSTVPKKLHKKFVMAVLVHRYLRKKNSCF